MIRHLGRATRSHLFRSFSTTITTTKSTPPLSTESILTRATNGDPHNEARTLIQQGRRRTRQNGEILIPSTTTQSLCDAYRACHGDLDVDGNDNETSNNNRAKRREFLLTLARDMNLDEAITREAIQNASKLNDKIDSPERFRRVTSHLRQTLTPAYETLFSRILAQVPDGMNFLVQLRSDLLREIRSPPSSSSSSSSSPVGSGGSGSSVGGVEEKEKEKENHLKEARYLKDLDMNLKTSMVEWFSMSFISLERITMNMSGNVLDQIVQGEKVHPIQNFSS